MNFKNSVFAVAFAALLSCLTAGCLTDYSGSAYDPEFVRKPHIVKNGVITRMDVVQIQGEGGVAGSLGGAVAGGILGSMVGGGRGSALAATGGAVAGGLLGNAVEKKMTTQNATEFEVQLDDGSKISVVQTLGGDTFFIGQQVRVLVANDGTTRIRPY